MSANQEQLISLFDEDFKHGVRFQQDGVILKGNAHDDKRNYVGSLLIMLQPPAGTPKKDADPFESNQSTPRSPVANVAPFTPYLVWLPYSYLFCLAPHMVSPAARRCIESDSELPLDVRDQQSRMKVEWMYTICLPISRIAKMLRKSNLRGKKILTITRIGNSVESPLIFQEGGIMKFFDELKKLAEVKASSPQSVDEFSIEERKGIAASLAAASEAAEGSESNPPETPTDQQQNSANPSPTAASASATPTVASAPRADPNATDAAAFQKELYGAPASPGMMSQMLNFGAQIGQKTKGALGAVAGAMSSNSNDHLAEAQLSNESSDFCMVEAPVGIEDLVPKIKPPQNRKLGAPLSAVEWKECFDKEGRVDPEMFREARIKAFSGGIASEIRGEVWSFLLNVYPLTSTAAMREEMRTERQKDYENIKMQWKLITAEQELKWSSFREHKVAIEKDVIRTDRTHPAFADENGEKMKFLFNILMTYAMFNFDLGYCQGMSDMLSVILLLYNDEAVAYTHFKFLLGEKCEGNFKTNLKTNMSKQLEVVDTLTRVFCPSLYTHLDRVHATGMTFCFRWLLVLFKRELTTHNDVMLLWDVIFSSPFTTQYELLITAALVKHVGSQIVDQSLCYDELLKFTNAISGVITVQDIILIAQEFYDFVASHMVRKARLRAGENAFRPRLQDILAAFENGGDIHSAPSGAGRQSPTPLSPQKR